MSRVYGEKELLDYGKVGGFFERRSRRIEETGPLSVTMYQTEEFAERRDGHEKAVVMPDLGAGPTTRVLDIACGTGRWGRALSGIVASYLGIDFCDGYVRAGRQAFERDGLDPDRFSLQTLQATAVSPATLSHAPPFDLVIIAGLLIFLNDDDVLGMLDQVRGLVSARAVIYMREPVAIVERLTLLEHPSEQLQDTYNAIYRTDQEMREIFAQTLLKRGGRLETSRPLFPPELQSPTTRSETEQRIYIIKMSD